MSTVGKQKAFHKKTTTTAPFVVEMGTLGEVKVKYPVSGFFPECEDISGQPTWNILFSSRAKGKYFMGLGHAWHRKAPKH
jgi:hypothetical protein